MDYISQLKKKNQEIEKVKSFKYKDVFEIKDKKKKNKVIKSKSKS
jgi:hypothetical protein